MPLITSKELLEKARKEHFGIGGFNASNMEMVMKELFLHTKTALKEHAE